MMKCHLPRLALVAALCLAGAAHAADVGRVLLAAGDTVAIRGNQTVKLAFGTAIQDQDLLRTGPASNLQVRFIDESIVSLKEASELRIDEFQFSGREDGKERGFFSLIKGGLRAVTGLVGRSNNANYRLSTTTATIGIRGTDYAATLCQGDCRNNDGSPAKDGLYGRVLGLSHGTNRIDVRNERDSKAFGINENFYVADAKSIVEPLLVAPDFVSNKLEGRKQGGNKGESGGSGTEQATTGGAAAESRPSTTPDPLPQLQFVATQDLNAQGTSAVLPPANGFVVVYPLSGGTGALLFDDDQLAATFNALNQVTSYGSLGTFPSGSLSSGTITDAGSLTLANGQTFSWGRWTGPTLVTTSGGSTLSDVPLLFGTATGLQDELSGQFGGVATYTYAGGPKPVDAGGNVGSITSTSATINFTTQTALFSLGMNFPSIVAAGVSQGPASFNVSGSGSKTMSSFTGDFAGSLSGSCTGSGCLSSTAGGFFAAGTTGPNGYDFSVFGGLVNGTQAGEVAFLNAYLASSFTPGLAPIQINAEVAWADPVNAPGSTFSVSTGPNATFDSSNNLTSFTNPTPCSTGTCTLNATLSTGSIVNPGSTTLLDGGTMNWGRWSGGQVTDRIAGVVTTYTPPTGVLFVGGTGNTIVPTSGSFTYTFAGGPPVVNTAGVVGSSLSQGAFLINFGATQSISVATPLVMSVGGATVTLSTACGGACSFAGPAEIMNLPLSGSCVGSCTSIVSGSATGFLVGPQASGLAVTGNVFTSPTITFAGAFKQ